LAYSDTTEVFNFGQDSSFSGLKIAQGKQDANGIGDFYYTPPTGYLALCSKNLANPSIVPLEHFKDKTYTGNGSTNNNITGYGFQPDLLYIKNTQTTGNNMWFDAVRGTSTLSSLRIDSVSAAASPTDEISAFLSDGFTTQQGGDTNGNNQLLQSMAWKVPTAVSGTTTGSGTDMSYSGRVNTDAKVSIIKYSPNGTAGHQIPHHLGVAPDIVTIKNLTSHAWEIYLRPFAFTRSAQFNNDWTGSNNGVFNDTHPTSSVVTISAGNGVNRILSNNDNRDYMMYSWASVEGYSKYGKYVGNGSNDGTFVFTNFKPSVVWIKAISISGEHWNLFNDSREPYNVMDDYIKTNENTTVVVDHSSVKVDMLSNGFKLRGTNSGVNSTNTEYWYFAWAETPFKYTNAR